MLRGSVLHSGLLVLVLSWSGSAQDRGAARLDWAGEVQGTGFDPAAVQVPQIQRAAPRHITGMDLLRLRDLTGVQISPDGKSVAYVVSQANYETNSYRSGLFVVGTEVGGKPVNLGSAGPPRWDDINQNLPEQPQWSPDSRYVTYRLYEGGRWQVWRWNGDGGERTQLTHAPYDVQSYRWSNDGSSLILVCEKDYDPERVRSLEQSGILYDGGIRLFMGKPIERAELEKTPKQTETWMHELSSGKERKATAEETARLTPWQKDAKNPQDRDVYQPVVSPDGKLLAYWTLESDVQKSRTGIRPLYVRPIHGGQPIEISAAAYHQSYWWSPDSTQLFYSAYQDDGRAPALFVVSAKGGTARRILGSKDWLTEFSVDSSGGWAACVRENPTTPPELALVELKTGSIRTLANVNPEFQNIELSRPTRLEWKNAFGESGFGYLVKPLDYQAGMQVPLIVTGYRAGEMFMRGATGDEYPIQLFAAHGFAVLHIDLGGTPNFRVGDFEAKMQAWRSPLASLEAALKLLQEMGVIDANHRGICGLSRGAETVEFAISHSQLFQAAVESGAAGRDPYFYYMAGNSWHKIFGKWGLRGRPDEQSVARWRELSPALNADRIRTPLLANTASTELLPSLQLYTLLDELGKPHEVFVYPNELHIKNQPRHRYEIYQRNLDWFKFWLQGQEDPDPAKADQYQRWRKLRAQHKWNEKIIATGKDPGVEFMRQTTPGAMVKSEVRAPAADTVH